MKYIVLFQKSKREEQYYYRSLKLKVMIDLKVSDLEIAEQVKTRSKGVNTLYNI